MVEIGEKTIQTVQRNVNALLSFGRGEMNRVFQRDKSLIVSLKIKFLPGRRGDVVVGKAGIRFVTDEFDHETDFLAQEDLPLDLELAVLEASKRVQTRGAGWFGMPEQWTVGKKWHTCIGSRGRRGVLLEESRSPGIRNR